MAEAKNNLRGRNTLSLRKEMMMTMPTEPQRRLRVCYLNAEPQIIDVSRMDLEQKLQVLGDLSIHTITSLSDPLFSPCDLLVVAAQKIPSPHFPTWLESFSQKIQSQGHIWVPALIVADASFPTLRKVLASAVKMNWYFDIVGEGHLDSLPIRVANLLRIHDHLHELARYEATLGVLGKKIEGLAADMQAMREGQKAPLAPSLPQPQGPKVGPKV